ncbi:MAG: hypothetical protein IPJ79_08195 [Bacteroidetes bacterium]|nr:hypothetical protein [Bacteroidota bacterium]
MIKEIDALLKKRMDKLVSFFRLSNNSFYNTYFNERAINDPKKNFTEIYARIVNKETGETIEGALMKAIGSKGTEFTEVSNYQGNS